MSQTGASSVTYCDVRARQLEGTYPGHPKQGVWGISAARVMRGWGIAPEGEWPGASRRGQWPPPEPPGIDAEAKPNRIHHYQRIRTADECRLVLSKRLPVSASFKITQQWYDVRDGLIEIPEEGTPTAGSHCICLLDYVAEYDSFVFVNSWGEKWGHNGFGMLPSEFFDANLIEAWVYLWPGLFPPYFQGRGIKELGWSIEDSLGGVLRGREVYDAKHDDRIAWAFVVCREGFLDVEELFVMPTHRRRGHGRQLADMLRELAEKEGANLRLWVPFADCQPDNLPGAQRIASYLGLQLVESGVRWAALKGIAHAELPQTPLPAAGLLSGISKPQHPPQLRFVPSTARATPVADGLTVDDLRVDPSKHAASDHVAEANRTASSISQDAFEKTSSEVLEKYSALYERLASGQIDDESEAPDSTRES